MGEIWCTIQLHRHLILTQKAQITMKQKNLFPALSVKCLYNTFDVLDISGLNEQNIQRRTKTFLQIYTL